MYTKDKKYWFYEVPIVVRVLLVLFLFPIFMPIAIWPILNFKPMVKYSIVVIWTFLMFTFYFVGGNENVEVKNSNLEIVSIEGIPEEGKTSFVPESETTIIKIKTNPKNIEKITLNDEALTEENGYYLKEYKYLKENDITIKVESEGSKKEKKIFFKADLVLVDLMISSGKTLEELKLIYVEIGKIELKVRREAEKKYGNTVDDEAFDYLKSRLEEEKSFYRKKAGITKDQEILISVLGSVTFKW